jgi:hypothetical protein
VVEKWIDLKYTSKFNELTLCVRYNSQNLAQILYHKDFILVNFLETQDTNIIESAFQCLSYLFKFLWRYMLKDLENVYK